MKDYRRIAESLCEGFLELPSGCDGCPLAETGSLDEEGNMNCELYVDEDEE